MLYSNDGKGVLRNNNINNNNNNNNNSSNNNNNNNNNNDSICNSRYCSYQVYRSLTRIWEMIEDSLTLNASE